MHFEYLLFNLFIFFSSTLAVWLYPHSQKPQLSNALKAISIIALPFIVADVTVTDWFWSFNPNYIVGLSLFKVPIEEILFFFIVPWACLLIWVNIKDKENLILRHSVLDTESRSSVYVWWIGQPILVALLIYGFFYQLWYTFTVSIFCFAVLVFFDRIKNQRAYILFAVVTLVLTLIFNTYLTARPVVTYNPYVMTNLRVGTVPLEDFLYGLLLTIGVVKVYEYLNRV